MLNATRHTLSSTARRAASSRIGAHRTVSSTSSSDDSPPPPPPPPNYFSAATIYPFILLSAITSLALNLSHQRTARETEGAHFRAQISVLEAVLARLRSPALTGRTLSAQEQEEIERELELVGLGRGKGKQAVDAEGGKRAETSWTEVFLGKKGKGFDEEEDKTDWEKVFREADEAEKNRQSAPSPPAPIPSAPTPSPSPASGPAPARPASASPSSSDPPAAAPPVQGGRTRAVFL
ncbi:hypothetical protein JCM8097_001219 [Rhodosporidiobolus ruineniae]